MTMDWERIIRASLIGGAVAIAVFVFAALATATEYAHVTMGGGWTDTIGDTPVDWGGRTWLLTNEGGGQYWSDGIEDAGGSVSRELRLRVINNASTLSLVFEWRNWGSTGSWSMRGTYTASNGGTVWDLSGTRTVTRSIGAGPFVSGTSHDVVGGPFDPNDPPVVVAENHVTVDEDGGGAVCSIDVSVADGDGTIEAWEWVVDGEEFDSEKPLVVSLPVGSVEASVRVQDDDGAWSEWEEFAVTVLDGQAVLPELVEAVKVEMPEVGGCGGVSLEMKVSNSRWSTGSRVLRMDFNRLGWNSRFLSHAVTIDPRIAPILAGRVKASEGFAAIAEPDALALTEELLTKAADNHLSLMGAKAAGAPAATLGQVFDDHGIDACPDRDGDGIPDDVDAEPDVPAGGDDADGDGLADAVDPCPVVADCDGDGVGDAVDGEPESYGGGRHYAHDDTSGTTARLAPGSVYWALSRKNPGSFQPVEVDDIELDMPEAPYHSELTRLENQSFGTISQRPLELDWDFTENGIAFAPDISWSTDFESMELGELGLKLADGVGIFRQILSVGVAVLGLTRVVKDLGG